MDKNNNKTNIVSEKDGYTNLANAIILQAVKDYRTVLVHLSRFPNNIDSKKIKKEVEIFFRSDWYRALTDVDGEMLIRKLNEEVM